MKETREWMNNNQKKEDIKERKQLLLSSGSCSLFDYYTVHFWITIYSLGHKGSKVETQGKDAFPETLTSYYKYGIIHIKAQHGHSKSKHFTDELQKQPDFLRMNKGVLFVFARYVCCFCCELLYFSFAFVRGSQM